MSTFLFFNVPTTGHVDPTLPVAAELVRRGHRVVYFLTEAYRERIEATGAVFYAYRGLDSGYFDPVSSGFNPVRLAAQLLESTIQLLPSLVEAVEQVRPQAIFYDSMCPWGRIAARQTGLPAVASMALMDLPLSYLLKSGEMYSALGIMSRGLPWIRRYMHSAQILQQTTGVAVPPFARLLNWPGDHNICYSARVLQPVSGRNGSSYSYVGLPVEDAPADSLFPSEKMDGRRPLVYISLGTVFNNDPAFFRTCLAALAGSDLQVLVSTGRRLQAADLAPLPDNALIRDYVPQQAVLKHASLFISHSGANSVHQALYYGVPLLLVPQQLEQTLIAVRVSELGAGLLLNRRHVTKERIHRLAQQLLTDRSFHAKAADLGAALREAGGAALAANELEKVAAGQAPIYQ